MYNKFGMKCYDVPDTACPDVC